LRLKCEISASKFLLDPHSSNSQANSRQTEAERSLRTGSKQIPDDGLLKCRISSQMNRDTSTRFSKARLKCLFSSGLSLAVFAAGFLLSCHRNINIVSRTETIGTVNGAVFKNSIVATINVGRGGNSTCTFEQLPPQFTPGTLSTHA
jgi:hypothetical protein